MKIAVYGGSFNPPHPGHVKAARAAYEALAPDKFIVMPAADPPHKDLPAGTPSPEERLNLTRIAFRDMPEAEVSDMEVRRSGESYTSDTVAQLQMDYPGAEIIIVMGTDMLLSFETWRRFRWLLDNTALAVLARENGEDEEIETFAEHLRQDFGARIVVIKSPPMPMSSSKLRDMLTERQGADVLDPEVYARIIEIRAYDAKPQLDWLREQAYSMLKPGRIPHVRGCEEEAARLAHRWGEDPETAAEAGILHDITKKLVLSEQLLLCEKYGIIVDSLEAENAKLLHSKTGAAVARGLFGVPDDIYDAICWHTTGRPAMSMLDKIIYMADYIEPNRNFDGVMELRRLAYEDIDAAVAMGLSMSVDDLQSYGAQVHEATKKALEYYRKGHNGVFWRQKEF